MNKKDLTIVILLALLIPAWMFIDRTFVAPRYATPTPLPSTEIAPASEAPIGASSTSHAISAAPVPLCYESSYKTKALAPGRTLTIKNV